MSLNAMYLEKTRNDIKPFCPIHHWRMAHDVGSTKVGPSYHCNYDGCTVLYTQSQGYFDLNKTAETEDFVVSAELLFTATEALPIAIRAQWSNNLCPQARPKYGTRSRVVAKVSTRLAKPVPQT
jgi:hypothetical protein